MPATSIDKETYDAFMELMHRAACAVAAIDTMPGELHRYCAADLTEMHDDQQFRHIDSTFDEWVLHIGGLANVPSYAACLAAAVARGTRDSNGFEVKR